MDLLKLLNAPLPSPKPSLQKLIWILLLGVGCSLFILLYNPFGIADQRGELSVNLLLFSLGIVFSLSIILLEWSVPVVFPRLFQRWTIGKSFIWYTVVVLFAGTINFLYKSLLGGFRDFTLIELGFVLLRTLVISITVAFFIVGILQFLNRKRLSSITAGQQFQIKAGDGKTVSIDLNSILYVSSDDNYVDIHFLLAGVREKLILRSSLKNIEAQIVNPVSPVVRCHRQYLVNINGLKVEKSTSRSMVVCPAGSTDQIPVSAKYVQDIKKRLSSRP